jgi:uncharacterized protein YidB (DUF937 family)
MGISESLGGMFGKDGGGFDMDNVNALLEQFGGVDGIMRKLQDSGLGDQLSSWIGKGDNAPISADQVKNALGADGLDAVASKTGLDVDDLVGRISDKLPGAIDKMTPDGAVPDGGFNLDSLTKAFGS